ncbi:hypothetical protein Tsubulata_013900 [Turnera subulata]|uniref:ENTH domain-containing protein n=1 Tax=Turnera subulata TaxID=218843 RepID=A0A9Q0J2E6_9ROSI|nr:hypothetical protein Tsubulata_013900 [Turnera subulata]
MEASFLLLEREDQDCSFGTNRCYTSTTITNGDPWAPEARTMGVISRAAFEVDEYYRIVDILHKRLMKFDRKAWRVCYKALLLLEHLLTHGPLRIAEEFQCDRDVVKEMESFQFVDDKGFNWGLRVRNLSTRILKLLEDGQFLKDERARTRKITRDIQGFGSFSKRPSSDNKESFTDDGTLKGMGFRTYWRRNSYYSDGCGEENELAASKEKLLGEETTQENQHFHEDIISPAKILDKGCAVEDHPFCAGDHHIRASLLST